LFHIFRNFKNHLNQNFHQLRNSKLRNVSCWTLRESESLTSGKINSISAGTAFFGNSEVGADHKLRRGVFVSNRTKCLHTWCTYWTGRENDFSIYRRKFWMKICSCFYLLHFNNRVLTKILKNCINCSCGEGVSFVRLGRHFS
jgi:hypothetical protein